MTRARPVVAIDGPAGAGKSSVTRRVAEELGYLLVDTGALYRAVALAAARRGIAWEDSAVLSELARRLAENRSLRFERAGGAGQRVLLDDLDVTLAIRTPEIGGGASKVSAIAGVREALLEMQRIAGQHGGVVLEGRDIGTVVFPDAEAKFYLTASLDVRSQRRFDELSARGAKLILEDVRREVVERDHRDSTRHVAPLCQAADAQLVDSSLLGIEEVVSLIVRAVREVEARLAERARQEQG